MACHANLSTVLRAKMHIGKVYAVFLSDLVMLIKTAADNSLLYLVKLNFSFTHICCFFVINHCYSRAWLKTGPSRHR